MHKEFFRTLIFIAGMTIILGDTPTIAMNDEEIPLTKHSMKVDTSKLPFGIDPADHYHRFMSGSNKPIGRSIPFDDDKEVSLPASHYSKNHPQSSSPPTRLMEETPLVSPSIKKKNRRFWHWRQLTLWNLEQDDPVQHYESSPICCLWCCWCWDACAATFTVRPDLFPFPPDSSPPS